jgi:hypothetical protein
VSDWRVVGASVAGSLHVRRGVGCDDAHGWATNGSITLLAVADGAGSRSGTSALGAHAAVTAVLETACGNGFARRYATDPEQATADLFAVAGRWLEREAELNELVLDDLATTLCVAVIGEQSVTVGQVGDGYAGIETRDGDVELVAMADRFEYANEVVFLTRPDALEHLKVFRASAAHVNGIALSSDGLRYKLLDDVAAARPFTPFFRDSWRFARSADASSEAIESFLSKVEDQTGDDLTLILAVRSYQGAAGAPRTISKHPGAVGLAGAELTAADARRAAPVLPLTAAAQQSVPAVLAAATRPGLADAAGGAPRSLREGATAGRPRAADVLTPGARRRPSTLRPRQVAMVASAVLAVVIAAVALAVGGASPKRAAQPLRPKQTVTQLEQTSPKVAGTRRRTVPVQRGHAKVRLRRPAATRARRISASPKPSNVVAAPAQQPLGLAIHRHEAQ